MSGWKNAIHTAVTGIEGISAYSLNLNKRKHQKRKLRYIQQNNGPKLFKNAKVKKLEELFQIKGD